MRPVCATRDSSHLKPPRHSVANTDTFSQPLPFMVRGHCLPRKKVPSLWLSPSAFAGRRGRGNGRGGASAEVLALPCLSRAEAGKTQHLFSLALENAQNQEQENQCECLRTNCRRPRGELKARPLLVESCSSLPGPSPRQVSILPGFLASQSPVPAFSGGVTLLTISHLARWGSPTCGPVASELCQGQINQRSLLFFLANSH